MKHHEIVALFAVASTLCACAGNVVEDSAEDEPEFESTSAALEALAPGLPDNTTDVVEVRSLNLYGCRFTIGTATQAPPFPPTSLTWIRKAARPGRLCRNTGYRVVNTSYQGSTVDLAKHPILPLLVFSSSTKGTPSGSSPTYVFLAQVDYRDLSIVRSDSIRALREPPPEGGPIGPLYGNVDAGYLDLDLFGNLTVTGTFFGYIPGMTGTGTNYQAFYPHYVFTPSSTTIVPSVVAY